VLAVVVILVLTGIVTVVTAVAGAGFFGLIVIPIGIALAVWLGLARGAGTRASDLASRESSTEFLGPGGPDDPNR
jgi:hypothetical protein